jgi:hypothetical protein
MKKKRIKINREVKIIIGIVLLSIGIVLAQVLIGIVATLLYYY